MEKRYTALLALALALCLLAGCGSAAAGDASPNGTGGAATQDTSTPSAMEEQSLFDSSLAASDGKLQPESARKIIYNAELELESKAFDDARAALLDEAARVGGYIQSSNAGGSAEKGTRWANYTLRIPADRYTAFLQAAEGAANLVRKSEDTQDVTAQYVDVQARLDSLNAQHARLLELMTQAEKLEDILAIQNQLTEVEYQLDSYTAQLRTYDDLVDYSTVTVYLSEVQALTVVPTGFGSRVSNAFRASWADFAAWWQDFAVGFVYALPALLVAAVLAAAAVPAVRAVRRRAALRPRPTAARRPSSAADYGPIYQRKPEEKGGPAAGGGE